jgi:endonuclease/exonuclease/phosphatase family metal-dependent hydrolase
MTELNVASLNLCWQASDVHRARQREVIRAGNYDVVLLQEARKVDLRAIQEDFDWCCHSLSPEVHHTVLGTAILGRNGTTPIAQHQLPREAFANTEVYDDLARWFHERHIAVDVQVADGPTVRMLSAHATPGTSDGPGSPKRGVGHLKPWFHTQLALWIREWPSPFLFAIDANTPAVDTLDWATTRFHIPADGEGRPGEDLLLGPPGRRLHQARDLWRVWLDRPEGAPDREDVPAEGPLARSHLTGGSWYRYDHLYATEDIAPKAMRYTWDPSVSDHSLVSATISIT